MVNKGTKPSQAKSDAAKEDPRNAALADPADGNKTAVDPGEPGEPDPLGVAPAAGDDEALEEYKDQTGDPSGTAQSSAEAAIIAAAEAQIPGVVVQNTNAAAAAKRAQEQARQLEGAKPEKVKPRPNARLKALKYPMRDPTNGVWVSMDGTPSKVQVSNWMQSQVEAGLVAVIED